MAFTAQPQRHALSHTLSGSTASRVKTAPARHRQRGNAVLFSLLAMVIGGVVVAVGINQYQDAERAATVQSTVSEVNFIIGSAKQNYGQYGYAGLTNPVSLGSRVIPANLQQGTSAQNKFGGAITLQETSAGSGTASLIYANVPSDVCTSIVNGTQGLAQSITVGTTPVKAVGSAIVIGTLNTACQGTGGVATITWVFGRG